LAYLFRSLIKLSPPPPHSLSLSQPLLFPAAPKMAQLCRRRRRKV